MYAIRSYYARLKVRAASEMAEEGIERDNLTLEASLDIRYLGQSFELTIPFSAQVIADFHQAHHVITSYSIHYTKLYDDPFHFPVIVVHFEIRVFGIVKRFGGVVT